MNSNQAVIHRRGPDFYLASASPRRRVLLAQIGCRFEVWASDVAEAQLPGEPAAVFVQRLALEKARAGWEMIRETKPLPVLGADTAVVIDGRVLGKPTDAADACAMLSALSGREHQVMTGLAMVDAMRSRVLVSTTRVFMREISPGEIRRYWEAGEGRDKAGAYAAQGYGAVFIARMEGSYSGVVGLPLFEAAQLLADFGIDCWLQEGLPA